MSSKKDARGTRRIGRDLGPNVAQDSYYRGQLMLILEMISSKKLSKIIF